MLKEADRDILLFRSRFLKQKDYWENKLAGHFEETGIMLDYETGPGPGGAAEPGHVIIPLSVPMGRRIITLSKQSDLSVYILLLTALKALIYRYGGGEDIVVFSPVNRLKISRETLNGTLLIRDTVEGAMTFKELVLRVRQSVLAAHENQDYPFDKLVESMSPSLPHIRCTLGNLHRDNDIRQIKTGLSFDFIREDGANRLKGELRYDPAACSRGEAGRLAGHLVGLLEKAVENVDIKIAGISFLTAEEKHRLLMDFNDNRADFSRQQSIYHFFEAHAEKKPGAAAVSFMGTEITYEQLNGQANRLAAILREGGVREDQTAGILLKRSPLMMAGILAVWKAGGAYIPLDTDTPVQRISGILADSGCGVLVTRSQHVTPSLEKSFAGRIIKLDTDIGAAPHVPANPGREIDMNGLAYIIYTSGSTGKPKGAMVEHIGMMNHIGAKINDLGVTEKSIVAQNASHTFDISVWQFFTAVVPGGKTVIYPDETVFEPELFISRVREDNITILEVVPSYLSVMLDFFAMAEPVPLSVDYLLVTGETVKPHLLQRWFRSYPHIKVVNAYGPTEASDDITHHVMEQAPGRTRVPIGKPLQNLNIYIVDPHMNLCPPGVKGEIWVSGVGVGRGYLNNPELTAGRFIPVSNRSNRSYRTYISKKIYKTGDLAHWRSDGTIEFFGRKDYQVKIRGFRIELGEIESYLTAYPDIDEAVVIVKETAGSGDSEEEGGGSFLCAFLVTTGDRQLEVAAVRDYLAERLPDYMIPEQLVKLERMPLTANGKINRKALRAVDAGDRLMVVKEYVPPRTPREHKLVALWSELLGMEKQRIGIDANFFEMGGQSLKATLLAARIHKEFNVKIPLVDVFQVPTVRELAEYIGEGSQDRFLSIEPVEEKEYYVMSSAQKRMYLFQQTNPESTDYNIPQVAQLDRDIDKEKLAQTFKELIRRHESLRTSFFMIEEAPLQRVHNHVEFAIEYYNLATEEEEKKKIQNLKFKIQNSLIRPFDLSHAPLLRVGLIKMESARYILVADMHHSAADGLSNEVLMRDFMMLEAGAGRELPLLRIQYKDYTQWKYQLDKDDQSLIKKQEEYWLKQFSGEIPVLDLPTDFERSDVPDSEGIRREFTIKVEQTRALKELALKEGISLQILMLAIFYILLARLSGHDDIVVGTAVAGRWHTDLEHIIGMFVNMLALRNFPTVNKTFREFVHEVKQNSLAAYENQDYPLEDLVEKVLKNRVVSRHPLFDVIFELRMDDDIMAPAAGNKTPVAVEQEQEKSVKPYQFERSIARFDIDWLGFEKGDTLVLGMIYRKELFRSETIDTHINRYVEILEQVLENTDIRLAHIDMIPGEEKKQILFDFNKEPEPLETGKTVYELFQEQVEKYPDSTAVVFENNKLTYKELNRKANRLARLLRKKGLGPNRIAALLFDWSTDMIAAMLAVLKAGAAYLPIDPDYPEKRITAVLEDSSAPVLLTTAGIAERFFFTTLQGLHKVRIAPHVTAPRPAVTNPDTLPIPHRSMVDYEKYSRYIGPAGVKNTYITLWTSRTAGPGLENLFSRSAENILTEIRHFYHMGVRRFVFTDNTFILDVKNSTRLFRLIIENKMELHLFFPNGLRGDILTRDYIDLMVEAGTVNIALEMETASPRLQKLLGKNLDIGKLWENLEYICEKYPQVFLELFITHGFPTETEEEALMTLDFLKALKWVDMPYFNILRIYPDTEVEKLALENGISREEIYRSEQMAPGELPDYLPFDKSFTLKCRSDLLDEYFLSRERLLHVLPYQMKIFTEEEIIRKYDSYLPSRIGSFAELLTFTGITPEELKGADFLDKERVSVPNLDDKIKESFPRKTAHRDALRVLLLDMSQLFRKVGEECRDFFEPPLGLMLLMTLLNRQYGTEINGKIAKSRVDFDNYRELKQLVTTFNPDIVGIRALGIYKDFFHKTAALIRDWGIACPIITGGPYASGSVETVLQDRNVDLVVLGEGEITFSDLIEKMIENKGKLPDEEILKQVPGIAFIPEARKQRNLFAREIFQLDVLETEGVLAEQSAENPAKVNQSTEPAYVIYTSGSTGTPKGILVEHRCFIDFTLWAVEEFEHRPGYQVLLSNSYASDGSIQQIFPPLVSGGTLHLVRPDVRLDAPAYVKYLKENKINNIDEVPVVMNLIFESVQLDETRELLPDLSCLSLGSEYVPIEVARKSRKYLNHEGRIINAYGPAETSVETCTYHFDGRCEQEKSLIGKPRRNLNVYILDQRGNLCPIGIPGEICIGGLGLARGYLNRPGLTAEKFNHDLWDFQDSHDEKKENYQTFLRGSRGQFFQKEPPGRRRLYKTGDQGCWQADGNIEFLGRIDNQVNIRGYRIELEEIQNQLLKLREVKEAVVLVKEPDYIDAGETAAREKYLCAYIVSSRPNEEMELRNYLMLKLPTFMIPARFVRLEKMPLSPNGKIDRKALTVVDTGGRGEKYSLPGNPVEEKLVEIWARLLNRKKETIGIDTNFFEIGGNSLKITTLVSRIQREFNVKLSLLEAIKSPTIRKLARNIPVEEMNIAEVMDADERLVLLKKAGNKEIAANIFFIHEITGQVEAYIQLSNHLNAPFACYGIRMDSSSSDRYVPGMAAIDDFAAQYIEIIKKIQPDGPYYIAGYSIGGSVAFAVARQLEQENNEVKFLGLIDTPGPLEEIRENNPQYTINMELDWVKNWLSNVEIEDNQRAAINEELSQLIDLNRVWPFIADYFAENHIPADILKKLVPPYIAGLIPNFEQMGVRELIGYQTLIHSFNIASNFYLPADKIASPVHFFMPTETDDPDQKEIHRWQEYCSTPIRIHEVPGNHISMMQEPDVVSFARQLDNLINA
jgi:amino acid adenylation domain-containing protein